MQSWGLIQIFLYGLVTTSIPIPRSPANSQGRGEIQVHGRTLLASSKSHLQKWNISINSWKMYLAMWSCENKLRCAVPKKIQNTWVGVAAVVCFPFLVLGLWKEFRVANAVVGFLFVGDWNMGWSWFWVEWCGQGVGGEANQPETHVGLPRRTPWQPKVHNWISRLTWDWT